MPQKDPAIKGAYINGFFVVLAALITVIGAGQLHPSTLGTKFIVS